MASETRRSLAISAVVHLNTVTTYIERLRAPQSDRIKLAPDKSEWSPVNRRLSSRSIYLFIRRLDGPQSLRREARTELLHESARKAPPRVGIHVERGAASAPLTQAPRTRLQVAYWPEIVDSMRRSAWTELTAWASFRYESQIQQAPPLEWRSTPPLANQERADSQFAEV